MSHLPSPELAQEVANYQRELVAITREREALNRRLNACRQVGKRLASTARAAGVEVFEVDDKLLYPTEDGAAFHRRPAPPRAKPEISRP